MKLKVGDIVKIVNVDNMFTNYYEYNKKKFIGIIDKIIYVSNLPERSFPYRLEKTGLFCNKYNLKKL